MERVALVLALVLVAGVAVACGDAGEGAGGNDSSVIDTSLGGAVALPDGESIYRPPVEDREGPAGGLLWYEESPSIGDARAWRTLGRSTGEDGEATWVTARVFRPVGSAPEGGFPIVVWAHGTAGLADECAPSRLGASVPAVSDLLEAGFVVVAPDGAGLGTPGPAAYLVGASEGRAVLDAAHMAAQVPGADAGDDVALWGYSSGGQAVLFAAELAEDYRPELTILGTAAVAPVSDVARFAGVAANFPLLFGYAFMTFGAWHEVYGADLSTIFAAGALEQFPLLRQTCSNDVAVHFALTPIEELRVADPTITEPWAGLMARNEAGRAATSGPVLLVQGTDDPIIDPASTDELMQRYCSQGGQVELRVIAGARHEVVLPTAPDVIGWLADRSNGVPPSSTCTP